MEVEDEKKSEDEQEEEDESSEYEEYTDSEEETGPRLKPVFVRKQVTLLRNHYSVCSMKSSDDIANIGHTFYRNILPYIFGFGIATIA